MPYQKWTPGMALGGNLKASFLNDAGDAIDTVRRMRQAGASLGDRKRPEAICKVKNGANNNLQCFRPFFIEGPAHSLGTYNQPDMTGCEEVTVTAGTWPVPGDQYTGQHVWKTATRWGIALENIPQPANGEYSSGQGCVGGVCIAVVKVLDAHHSTCGIDPNYHDYLTSGFPGATILYSVTPPNEGSQEQMCIIRIESGGSLPVFALITDSDRDGKYSWLEYGYNSETNEWGPKNGGLTGDHTQQGGYIIDVRGAKAIPKGVLVQAWRTGGVYSTCYDGSLLFGMLTADIPEGGIPLCGPVDVWIGSGQYASSIPAYSFGPIYEPEGSRVGLHYMPATSEYGEAWIVIYQECLQ